MTAIHVERIDDLQLPLINKLPTLGQTKKQVDRSAATKMADIKPPFTEETAKKKVKAAQDLWNTQ